jgi:hypothetical protein
VNHERLIEYALDAVKFGTEGMLTDVEFVKNDRGKSDIDVFDFTSLKKAEHAARIVERKGHRLLLGLVGDSLIEVSDCFVIIIIINTIIITTIITATISTTTINTIIINTIITTIITATISTTTINTIIIITTIIITATISTTTIITIIINTFIITTIITATISTTTINTITIITIMIITRLVPPSSLLPSSPLPPASSLQLTTLSYLAVLANRFRVCSWCLERLGHSVDATILRNGPSPTPSPKRERKHLQSTLGYFCWKLT